MRLSIRVLDYFFVLRPTLFFAVWTVSLAGYWAQERFGHSITSGSNHSVHYLVVLSLFTLIMGGVFLINQVRDIESDRFNKKLFLVANGDVTPKAAVAESFILVVLSLFVVFWQRPTLGWFMLVAFVVTGWLYSLPPFSAKDRPIAGLIVNVVGYFLVFGTGWVINGQIEWGLFLHALPYVLGITAVYFFTTVPDMEGDEKAGKITFAVRYGLRATILLSLGCEILAVVFSIMIRDGVILMATFLSLPFFIYTSIKMTVNEVLRTNKFGTLFLSLTICIKYPGYLILIVAIFFVSRWYYKNRFGINYPSFKST